MTVISVTVTGSTSTVSSDDAATPKPLINVLSSTEQIAPTSCFF